IGRTIKPSQLRPDNSPKVRKVFVVGISRGVARQRATPGMDRGPGRRLYRVADMKIGCFTISNDAEEPLHSRRRQFGRTSGPASDNVFAQKLGSTQWNDTDVGTRQ